MADGESGARLFDRILIIDWSAANSPTKNNDSIWIADNQGISLNFPTRDEAMKYVREVVEASLKSDHRLMIGWDFAFGYPAGFANAIGTRNWEGVWTLIHRAIEDTARNKSNRFDIGAAINRAIGQLPGPFWGYNGGNKPTGLSPKRYPDGDKKHWPFSFNYFREVEQYLTVKNLSASSVFQLAYNGCVGSQTLVGIARLESLRRRFPNQIAVWPFETSFGSDLTKPVILAEIYPSAHAVPEGPEVKDQRQVEAVLRDFLRWDADGVMREKLDAPSLTSDSREVVQREEGWVVGL